MTSTSPPAGVPTDAQYEPNDKEWVLGTKDEIGEFHGEVRYWREDGTLCNRCDFFHGQANGLYERFHENGDVSQAGVLERGQLKLVTYFRTDSESTEAMPQGAPPSMWVMQMIMEGGRPVAAFGFDRDGDVVPSGPVPEPPENVPANAIFMGDHWRAGESDEYRRPLGVWQQWSEEGRLIGRLTFEKGLVIREEEITPERPKNVAEDATFESEQEIWLKECDEIDGELNGERRVWREDGKLLAVEEYREDYMVRERFFMEDGTLASDCASTPIGLPKKRWFKRTDEHTLHNFPNVMGEHPGAKEVTYTFDDHGFMSSFRITGDDAEVLEHEDLYKGPGGNGGDQEFFATPEQASLPWRRAGDSFVTNLNAWLEVLYSDEEQTEPEPTFEAEELQRAYIGGIAELNKRGESAAKQFPTYHDAIHGFFWQSYGESVLSQMHTGNAMYARVMRDGKSRVFQITPRKITEEKGVLAFGKSADNQSVAFAMLDAVLLVDVSTGGVKTLSYPKSHGHPGAQNLALFKDPRRLGVENICVTGKSDVVLSTSEGVYHLREGAPAERLYPFEDAIDQYVERLDEGEGLSLELERVTVSCDNEGTLLACGAIFQRGIFAPHAIFQRQQKRFVLRAHSQEQAFFPGPTSFHPTHKSLSFSATLYASLSNHLANTTFRLDLDALPHGEITEFSGGVWQGPSVVNCSLAFGEGYLMGLQNGYLYWMSPEGETLGYVHVGGEILSLSSVAEHEVLVGADTGMLTHLRIQKDEPTNDGKKARNLITNLKAEDLGRIAFWRSYDPLRC